MPYTQNKRGLRQTSQFQATNRPTSKILSQAQIYASGAESVHIGVTNSVQIVMHNVVSAIDEATSKLCVELSQ